jgi:hypothetical protein
VPQKNRLEAILNFFIRPYPAVALVLLFAIPGFSQQTIQVNPAKNSILLGEPLTITVIISGDHESSPVIPDSLGSFEVLEKKPLKTKESNGIIESREEIIITCFDSGSHRIPPIAVEGNPSVVSAGIDIDVKTIPADEKSKYGDIKQIIALEPPNQWPYIAAMGLATLFSAIGIYRLNRKVFETILTPLVSGETTISPSSLVLQLSQLRRDWEEQKILPVELGNKLMEIFRKYLSGKGIYATSKTGEELVLATKTVYPSETWQRIVQTLRLCNAMRFGKYNARLPEGMDAIDAFEKAITPVETSNAGIKNA